MENYKIGYSYDVVTGEYIGEEMVWLEKATGTYPCASNVTFTKPPAGEGCVARWVGQKWELVPDHRGEIIYTENGLPKGIVDYIGDLKNGDITMEPPMCGDHEKPSWNGEEWDILLDEGYVREDDSIRQMTQVEKVEAGIEPMPDGCKIEGGVIVPLTLDELYTLGKLTLDEYNEYIRQEREMEYRRTTDKIGLMVLRGEATKEEWEDAILAVKAKWPYKEA